MTLPLRACFEILIGCPCRGGQFINQAMETCEKKDACGDEGSGVRAVARQVMRDMSHGKGEDFDKPCVCS